MGKNKPLVSIIVPIYNAEKYLQMAIESVLNQTYENFELLLINDRSTDNGKEICEKYAENDNRIKLLENNTENHGPGPTRNIGLDNAKGEFIYFMDADDWIDKRLLQSALLRMQETDADIVQFGFMHEQINKEPIVYCRKGNDTLTREDIKNNFLSFWNENNVSLWLQFFKRETVKEIRFENIINGEDVCYVMDALANAEKIAYISKAFYHYRVALGSTSHRWIDNMIECREITWNHKRELLRKINADMDKSIYADAAYGTYIWAIYHLSSNLCPLSYKEKKQQLQELNENMEFENYRKYCLTKQHHGIDKIKYVLVKYRLERILLLFGPLFLKIARGE